MAPNAIDCQAVLCTEAACHHWVEPCQEAAGYWAPECPEACAGPLGGKAVSKCLWLQGPGDPGVCVSAHWWVELDPGSLAGPEVIVGILVCRA